MEEFFDFSKEPGKKLERLKYEKHKPEISVIIPFYNDKDYIEQSVNCILNQTYPYFELLIVDDGSKDEESLKKLEEVSKLDERITVFHKQNEGLAATRDYGASKASKDTKYLMFIDSDDLIDKTFFECAYWALETNKDASWAYADSVGFGCTTYTWNKWFSSEKMKKVNDLISAAVIRKEAFEEVGGYELREKSVNEDWNFWLKLIAKGRYPVHMSYYAEWYRRKESGELAKATANRKRSLEIVKKTAKTITKKVEAIQYPSYRFDKEIVSNVDIVQPKIQNDKKIHLLMIIPWMVMGGADKFNIDLLSRLDKDKYDITIVSTEPGMNEFRQSFEQVATVYDLSSFLSQKDWLAFVKYIIEKNNINLIFNTNSYTGYNMLPSIKGMFPEIPIMDYIHMEEWYNRDGGYSRDSSEVENVIDKTICCNANSTRILEEYFGRNPKELGTVYIGVDEKKFDPTQFDVEESRKELNVNKKYAIGFICRISKQKRPFLMLEIAKKLKEKRDDFVILVAGDGELLEQVKKKAKKYGLKDNIQFLGRVLKPRTIYRASDVTLNCSIKEGLALTSYESLSMGTPVVSADVGGQKELINEDVGVIVPCMQEEKDIDIIEYSDEEIDPYVDGLNKVLDNIDQYKNKCRDRILNGFTIDQMVVNMDKEFTMIMENPNKEKIHNGQVIAQNLDEAYARLAKHFEDIKDVYEWQAKEFNIKHGMEGTYKLQIFREKMWKHAWYRGIVKVFQKIGIIKFAKKIIN